jgi:hypothetical protein
LDESFTSKKIPLCAANPLTVIEVTSSKEIQTLLKCGRDSARPLKTTAASCLDEQTSLSIIYNADWRYCDGTIEWVWTKSTAAAVADQITVPPAFDSPVTKWELYLRKENNAMHILIQED